MTPTVFTKKIDNKKINLSLTNRDQPNCNFSNDLFSLLFLAINCKLWKQYNFGLWGLTTFLAFDLHFSIELFTRKHVRTNVFDAYDSGQK
jgi:hypothetical protein